MSAVWGWIVTGWNALMAFFRTQQAAKAVDPLVAFIEAQNYAIPPMPGTGGVIHKITPAVAAQVAADLRKGANTDVSLDLATAWIRDESRYDPAALDPNANLNTPGQTAAQEAQHADIGIGQFDMATLEEMPEFKGASIAAIEAKAEDPDWGIAEFYTFASALMAGARGSVAANPALLDNIPNRDPRYLGVQAYNSGPTGAVNMAKTPGSNWAYSEGIISESIAVASVLSS